MPLHQELTEYPKGGLGALNEATATTVYVLGGCAPAEVQPLTLF